MPKPEATRPRLGAQSVTVESTSGMELFDAASQQSCRGCFRGLPRIATLRRTWSKLLFRPRRERRDRGRRGGEDRNAKKAMDPRACQVGYSRLWGVLTDERLSSFFLEQAMHIQARIPIQADMRLTCSTAKVFEACRLTMQRVERHDIGGDALIHPRSGYRREKNAMQQCTRSSSETLLHGFCKATFWLGSSRVCAQVLHARFYGTVQRCCASTFFGKSSGC